MTAPTKTPAPSSPVHFLDNTLPAYISQKPVWAMKISLLEPRPTGEIRVHSDEPGVQPMRVTKEWMARHKPTVGWYLVMYEDGYTSATPAEPFEAGCTRITDYGLPEAQEPKYQVGPRGRLYNRVSQQPIPDQEPVFVLRAQDKLALQTLQAYRSMSESAGVDCTSIDERIAAFKAFAAEHGERMKYPDTHTEADLPPTATLP